MLTPKVRIGVLVALLVVLGSATAVWAWRTSGLTGRLRSYDQGTRVEAATSLGQMERDDPSADEALIAALSDASESVRAAAADSLGKRESAKAGKPLVATLKDSAPAVRASAAYALGKVPDLGTEEHAALLAALQDPDPFVRRSALLAFYVRARSAESPEDARRKQFGPLMLTAMKDPAAQVRRGAAWCLREAPAGCLSEPEAALIAQAEALEDADPSVRTFTVNGIPVVLKAAGPKLAEPTLRAIAAKVPALVDGVITGDRDSRGWYQAALVACGQAARSSGFRAEAPDAEKARAALKKALQVPGPDVRPVILSALPSATPFLGGDDAFVEEVIRASGSEPALRASAVEATRGVLEAAGPADEAKGRLAVEVLRPLLADKNVRVRSAAYTILWQSPIARKAGGDALLADLRKATRGWMDALKDEDPATRETAAWCLSWTDREDADAAMTALIAAKDDGVDRVKNRVTKAITLLEAAKAAPGSWPEPSWEPFRRWGRPGG